jgi:CubicO group peptidase (beta-lactamase class C family)
VLILAGAVFAAYASNSLSDSGSSGPVGSGSALAAAHPATPATEAQAYLERLVRTRQFSGAVLVAEGGHIVLERGYGWASAGTRVLNTATTRFRIGSLTKAFTAMAVLTLENAGRLRLVDHVCSFIGECPVSWGRITLQELLTHTSGIPDYTTLRSYGRFSHNHATPAQIVALVRGRPLLFAPGSRWSYSNTGYVLLGMVIQRVSGQPYAAYLKQHVLAPLGLHSTGYDTNNPPLPTHALGYTSWGTRAAYIDMSVPYAAGALDSTVGDLYRWDIALVSEHPQLVQRDVLQQMFRPWVLVNPAFPKSGAYGDGWFIDDRGSEYDHDGDINGFVSSNAIFPAKRAEIVVLSNLESSDPRSISEHLAQLIGLHAA